MRVFNGRILCTAGGLFALGSHTLQNDLSSKYMNAAEGITNTCHEAYNRSEAKLAPESFRFIDSVEAKAVKTSEKYYILRPETVESYFTLWRITKNPMYRKWGWEVVEVSISEDFIHVLSNLKMFVEIRIFSGDFGNSRRCNFRGSDEIVFLRVSS